MVLEGLGVEYDAFHMHQESAIKEAYSSTLSLRTAANFLEHNGLGTAFRMTSVLINLFKLGVQPPMGDTFYGTSMQYAINHVLRLIKHKGDQACIRNQPP
jgi:RNA-dependent RNA polymerase